MHFTSSEDQHTLLGLPAEHARAAVEHAQGLEDAASVMLHRTASYGLAWQRYGALSNLVNAARKVERLMGIWWDGNKGEIPALHKDALDDALDAINYLQFFITCARDGNLTGNRRELPDEDLFDFKAVWHVRHADGTTEDIVLEHGNLVEDDKGSCGQVIFSRG